MFPKTNSLEIKMQEHVIGKAYDAAVAYFHKPCL